VIHRDLKPANIMVGAFGENPGSQYWLSKILTAKADTVPGESEGEGPTVLQSFGRSGIPTAARNDPHNFGIDRDHIEDRFRQLCDLLSAHVTTQFQVSGIQVPSPI
jgi:serine/threonine protein kinase